MLNIFSCACWTSVCLLWKNIYSGLLPIFNWVVWVFFFFMLSCMSCLHILDINPFIVVSFADIFSHSIDCLFILLMISFTVQKLLHLIRSHLFIFAFVSFALGNYSYIFSNRKYTQILFSSIHSAFKKNYYIPGHRESLNKLQRMVF